MKEKDSQNKKGSWLIWKNKKRKPDSSKTSELVSEKDGYISNFLWKNEILAFENFEEKSFLKEID